MCRFRKWLIQKLGGYLPTKPIQITYTTASPIHLSVALTLNKYEIESADGYIKEELANKLTKGLLENNLITYDVKYEGDERWTYYARLYAFKEPK